MLVRSLSNGLSLVRPRVNRTDNAAQNRVVHFSFVLCTFKRYANSYRLPVRSYLVVNLYISTHVSFRRPFTETVDNHFICFF